MRRSARVVIGEGEEKEKEKEKRGGRGKEEKEGRGNRSRRRRGRRQRRLSYSDREQEEVGEERQMLIRINSASGALLMQHLDIKVPVLCKVFGSIFYS